MFQNLTSTPKDQHDTNQENWIAIPKLNFLYENFNNLFSILIDNPNFSTSRGRINKKFHQQCQTFGSKSMLGDLTVLYKSVKALFFTFKRKFDKKKYAPVTPPKKCRGGT